MDKNSTYLLSIVLPTFNEFGNVQRILEQIFIALKGLEEFEIIFVDDSSDQTPDVIRAEAARDSRIKLIHRPPSERDGLAGAFVEGFRHARGLYICCMDSDLQHPPPARAAASPKDLLREGRFCDRKPLH